MWHFPNYTQYNNYLQDGGPVLSVRFEVGVFLLLGPARADKRGSKAPFPLVGYAGIQLVIHKRVPAGAPVGARSF